MDIKTFLQDNPDWHPYADLVVRPPLPEELSGWWPDVSNEILSRSHEMVREGGGFVSRGAIYVRVRRESEKEETRGTANKWATMLALQAPPGLKTSTNFASGYKPWHEIMDQRYVATIKAKLQSKGVELTSRTEYMPELARFPGDPEAVLPPGRERDHIKKICESRGWACHDAVECEHRPPEQDPHTSGPPMAEDLVRQHARRMVHQDPSMRKLSRQELREAVIEKHGPSKTPIVKTILDD